LQLLKENYTSVLNSPFLIPGGGRLVITVDNRVLFLVFTALTSARQCSLLSIWHPPLVTHGYAFDPHSPIFREHRGPSSLPSPVLIDRPRKLQAGERAVIWEKKNGGMLHVCSSSNSTLKK